jgi:GT2 family glycosyltransferase/glycosyltransferase involved in cell wall biosynthesis
MRPERRLQLDIWKHSLLHPLATLRTAVARALPYRVRASILRIIRGGGSSVTRTAAERKAFFVPASTTAPEERAPRPTIIFLPAVDWFLRVQRPHHLLHRLATNGWPVFLANLQLAAGATEIDVDQEAGSGDLRNITLPGTRHLDVSERPPTDDDVVLNLQAFHQLRRRERIHQAVVLCQGPLWRPLAVALRQELGWPLVYDRMDQHRSFSTASSEVATEEDRLIEVADLVSASSHVLAQVGNQRNGCALSLPNACDPEHWEGASPALELEGISRPIIGYFGAIADWFDSELVASLATRRPDWSFVLVGSTWGCPTTRFEVLPNVHLLGERPYDELPALAAAFDVGIIPRRRTPLTEAMDPVKLYEMAACGLEIVASRLPGLQAHSDIVRLAEGEEGFHEAINAALAVPANDPGRTRRVAFARENSWDQRAETLAQALVELFPKVTIGIVAFNNRELTELCLDSIERCTVHPNFDVLVVDNASTDGTPTWLKKEAVRRSGLRVILNEENRGFGPACNQIFAAAEGEIFCLLNNDTVVTRGWLAAMVGALENDPQIGLVGPSSNGVANEARVEPGYQNLADLAEWADDFVWSHDGESFAIPMLALYCAALRSVVWEEVGGLDERFEVGLFEDDDLSRRIRRAGYDVRCLRGAWVHHFQEASFGALPDEEYARIYEANRRRFLAKWRFEEDTARSDITSFDGEHDDNA